MNIRTWCIENSINDINLKTTHAYMDKGNYKIPEIKMNEFYEIFLNNIRDGKFNSIVEQKTPIFKFFIDLDFKLKFELTLENKQEIVVKIQSILKEALIFTSQESNFFCIVSSCNNLNIGGEIKNGIHLIFPFIFVNKSMAIKIRNILVQGLYNNVNEETSLLEWEKIIDESVYTKSGLRIMFSYKYDKCIYCSEKTLKKINCDKCQNKKNIYSRPYYPILNLDNDGNIITIKNDISLITISNMFLFSIRSNEKNINIDFNNPLPTWFNSEINLVSNEETQMRLGKDYSIINNCDIYNYIEKYIKEFWHVYKNIKITTIYKSIFRNQINFSFRTNCHYCFNIGKEHKSNHVWFVLSPKRVLSQKCFDIDCKNFKIKQNTTLVLPQKIYNLLLDENKPKMEEEDIFKSKIESLFNDNFN